ncbi:hypothetical protein [Arthrobacter sp. GAS37]|uniref:hypothetical protein n=1 Tax=Arthrobacter sp. GAS37 TaxID=3156261 RepID=UPI00385098FD
MTERGRMRSQVEVDVAVNQSWEHERTMHIEFDCVTGVQLLAGDFADKTVAHDERGKRLGLQMLANQGNTVPEQQVIRAENT